MASFIRRLSHAKRFSTGPARLGIALAMSVAVSLGGTYFTTVLGQSDYDESLPWPAVSVLFVLIALAVAALVCVGVLLSQPSFNSDSKRALPHI